MNNGNREWGRLRGKESRGDQEEEGNQKRKRRQGKEGTHDLSRGPKGSRGRKDQFRNQEERRVGIWARLKIAFFMLCVLCALTLCWIAAFFLLRPLEWNLGPLMKQLVNSVLGFILFGLGISIISRFGRKRQIEFYQSIIDGLKRISKGDFQVTLPFRGDDGHLGGIVQSINDMAADLNNMETMRQEFISNVSHEIQSPLTSISGFARVLRDGKLSPDQRDHYLNIIEQESVRLSRLSENMLRLASLDSDKHPFHAVDMRLDKQIQSLILACEPQWVDKDLDMVVDLQPVTMEADSDLLSQVWVNLIHNAIKFTPHGGTVQVILESDEQEAVVRIKDTGIGIPDEDQAHIFERFYKADKSRTRSGGGSGLGLSIIHKIVQMHHGSVSVDSSLGEGTQMTVRLPMKAVPAPAP